MPIRNRILLALILAFTGTAGYGQTFVSTTTDTVYINVLMQMNFDSKTLQVAGEFDSARVYAFMKTNDPLYLNRPEYMISRLDMVQRVKAKSEDNMYLYDSLLAVTPTYLLRDISYHLYNKLNVMIPVSNDSAYEVIKLLSRSPSMFRSWVQNTFYQSFVSDMPDALDTSDLKSWRDDGISERRLQQMLQSYTPGVKNKKTLLPRLALDADTSISDYLLPLYLWNQVRTNPTDNKLQQEVIKGFSSLSYKQSIRGNAQKYALQLYKLLLKNGQTVMADSLLEHTITRLQRETSDSTNEARFAAQNLQAYAWELKYERVKTSDPKAALAFLGKASALSPKNSAEKDHDSFYDRHSLESKESYRSDYAEALIRSGDRRTAMKVMGDQLSSDPASIMDFQLLFQKQFPDGDFTRFFKEIVKQSWKQAPAFKLTGLDGKQHSLFDYKGKWLVMDFWGTWCAPCREELPDVNEFAKSVANSPDIAFLSVDCHDTETAVRSFIEEMKYTMPVVMSDKKIVKDYGVSGYPSKVIVSPNGSMLLLQFGAKWQTIVMEFNAVSKYPEKPKPVVNAKTTINNKQQ